MAAISFGSALADAKNISQPRSSDSLGLISHLRYVSYHSTDLLQRSSEDLASSWRASIRTCVCWSRSATANFLRLINRKTTASLQCQSAAVVVEKGTFGSRSRRRSSLKKALPTMSSRTWSFVCYLAKRSSGLSSLAIQVCNCVSKAWCKNFGRL